jgi:hypothetical protein
MIGREQIFVYACGQQYTSYGTLYKHSNITLQRNVGVGMAGMHGGGGLAGNPWPVWDFNESIWRAMTKGGNATHYAFSARVIQFMLERA